MRCVREALKRVSPSGSSRRDRNSARTSEVMRLNALCESACGAPADICRGYAARSLER